LVFSLIALLASILLLVKFRKFFPLFAILFGVFAGQAFTTTPQVVAEDSLGAFKIIKPKQIQSTTPKPVESNQGTTPKPVESNQGTTPKPVEILEARQDDSATVMCSQADEIIKIDGSEFRCKYSKTYQVIERNPTKTLKNEILRIQILEYKRNVNAIGAQSALPVNECQGPSRDIFSLIECNLNELPYRLFLFYLDL
jgi:uncharacterized secreted protein with C-terminal beta-propeller domain